MNKISIFKNCPFRQVMFNLLEFTMRNEEFSIKNERLIVLTCLIGIFPLTVQASTVRDDIPYQIYRDFAENRGQFVPGVTGIRIYKKDGSLLGIIDAPMPDWSFANQGGVASLINPQYVSTAKHTRGKWATTSRFGGSGNNPDYHRYTYQSVRLIDEDSNYDYSMHRLDKLVTEVVPIVYIARARAAIPFNDADRYPLFARMGNGYQNVMDALGNVTRMNGARGYLTGGTLGTPVLNKGGFSDITIHYSADNGLNYLFNKFPDKLMTRGEGGDSGSPLIVWDAYEKKWYLAGQFYGGNTASNRWSILNALLIQNSIDSDTLTPFTSSGNDLINWRYADATASGTITQGQQTLAMTGAKGTDNAGLDYGKNIIFTGDDGNIILFNNINQGAGALKFKGNYIVSPDTNESWTGAGLDIDTGKSVTWQVNGVKDDRLHKIGRGTLIVNGKGVNSGDLSVGDGTVVLNQRYDENNDKQAFNTIDIVSGRPTVVLNDRNQVNPDNIYFGYRGGRLDLNGNSLSFTRIHNVDTGAQIVNHRHEQGSSATVTITGSALGEYQTFQGMLGEADTSRVNGPLSLKFNPLNKNSLLLLAGGANLNGDIDVMGGTMLFSGRPVLHTRPDHTAGIQINEGEDWQRSSFNFNALSVGNNATLQVAEYADVGSQTHESLPDIYLNGNAEAILGYHRDSVDNQSSLRCYLDDNNGNTNCKSSDLTEKDINPNAVARVNANITLKSTNNILQLGNVDLYGAIVDEGSSVVRMDSHSHWKVAAESQLYHAGFTGGHVDLGSEAGTGNWKAKSLEITQLTSSGAKYTLGINATDAAVTADTIFIKDLATGSSNIIDMVSVPGSRSEHLPSTGIAVITAPKGTPHNLFDFSSANIGFTTIKPLTNVVDDINDENRVKWLLQRNGSPDEVAKIISLLKSVDNNKVADDPGPAEKKGAGEQSGAVGKEVLDVQSGAVGKKVLDVQSVHDEKEASGDHNGLDEKIVSVAKRTPDWIGVSDWLGASENTALLSHTASLMQTRQFAVTESLFHLTDRTTALRSAAESGGAWGTIRQDKGNLSGRSFYQTAITIGVDRTTGFSTTGIMANIHQGRDSGYGENERHIQAGFGIYNSLSGGEGLFLDSALSYQLYHQELTYSPALGNVPGKSDSNMLLLSARTGYTFKFSQWNTFVEPVAGLDMGYLDGYTHANKLVTIEQKSGYPLYAVAGFRAGKLWEGAKGKGTTLIFSVLRQQDIGHSAPDIALSDAYKEYNYSAPKDNRYRLDSSLQSQFGSGLSMDISMSYSTGDYFSTDYSGRIGMSYSF